jgi:hypothetical protein
VSISERDLVRIKDLYTKRVEDQSSIQPGYEDAWEEMTSVILGYGGVAVVPSLSPESRVKDLIREGRGFSATARPISGVPGECHRNTALAWMRGEIGTVATGYALSADGLWRQHSWGVDDLGQIAETTQSRLAYYGVELTGEQALAFCLCEAPAQLTELLKVASEA